LGGPTFNGAAQKYDAAVDVTMVMAKWSGGIGEIDQVFSVLRHYLGHHRLKRTLVGAVKAAVSSVRRWGRTPLLPLVMNCAVREPGSSDPSLTSRSATATNLFPGSQHPAEEICSPASFVKHQLITPKNVV